MGTRGKASCRVVVLAALGVLLSGAVGCGYLRNVRDDLMDCGTLAVGIVPPVAPTASGPKAIGPLPPAIGVYAEVTEFCHLGVLYKSTGDLEWDRRGVSATIDTRTKVGFGPLHYVCIEQTPVMANAYKRAPSEMDGWRTHMKRLKDPLFKSPAKTLIYKPKPVGDTGYDALPYLSRGWQDWEMISLEVAIPEPCCTHSGMYARIGVDPSQFVDLILSVFCVDMHSDAAYTFWGDLKHAGGS